MLIGKILHSPIAHGTIKHIDVSKARALPGVHAVLTYLDVPRVVFSTAGQSHPIPSPLDFVSLIGNTASLRPADPVSCRGRGRE